MKSKFMITIMTFLLIGGGYAFAQGGHDEGADNGSMVMDRDSMMGDEGMMNEDMKGAESSQVVEVGNEICPVSGDRIDSGEMGEAVKYEYNGKIYNLCCKMCIKDFKKNPEKYSKIAEDEVQKTKEQAVGK